MPIGNKMFKVFPESC